MRKWSGKKLLRKMRNWRWWIGIPILLLIATPFAVLSLIGFVGEIISMIPDYLYRHKKWFGYDVFHAVLDWVERGER